MGRYGPIVVIGDKDSDEKPRFASLMKNQLMETITIEDALNLFKLPRIVGAFEGFEVKANVGRFGPYVLHNNKFYSLKKGIDDPYEVTIDRAIELIDQKRLFDQNKLIKAFPEDAELLVLNGRFGPYISFQKENYKVPKAKNPPDLSYKDCLAIIAESKKKPARKKFKKK